MSRGRGRLTWLALAVVIAVPLSLAAASPLLAWRDPIYISAGFAGVIAISLLLLQPLLVGGYLPLAARAARQAHRIAGLALIAAVVVHVAGLWITSPPDVIDALVFDSPTPFSDWGVIAMWSVFAAAVVAVLRQRLRLRMPIWRLIHTGFAAVTVVASIVHAVLIEGTMETWSKAALCGLVAIAAAKVLFDLRVWAVKRRSG